MEATISRDGLKRFTINVKHRMGFENICYFLAVHPDLKSRTAVFKKLKDELFYGSYRFDCGRWEDLDYEDRDIAEQKVKKLFPELEEE